jgi:hypothetical protein
MCARNRINRDGPSRGFLANEHRLYGLRLRVFDEEQRDRSGQRANHKRDAENPSLALESRYHQTHHEREIADDQSSEIYHYSTANEMFF